MFATYGSEEIAFNDMVLSDKKPNRTFYSDRLRQWDLEKYNRVATKVLGSPMQMYYGVENEKLEKLLIEYFGEKLTLVKVSVSEHAASGFPIWRFDCHMDE